MSRSRTWRIRSVGIGRHGSPLTGWVGVATGVSQHGFVRLTDTREPPPEVLEARSRRLSDRLDLLISEARGPFIGGDPVSTRGIGSDRGIALARRGEFPELGECVTVLRSVRPLIRRDRILKGGHPYDDAVDVHDGSTPGEVVVAQAAAVTCGDLGQHVEVAGVGAPARELHRAEGLRRRAAWAVLSPRHR